MLDLERSLTEFQKIVSPDFCKDLAKRCKLVQRSTSQLEGYELVQAIATPNGFLESETLNSLAARMRKINPNCNLSAPALCQRINSAGAELFMKCCFEKVLANVIKKNMRSLSDISILSIFNRVLLEDSTTAQLHEELSSHFPGSGGSASKSSMKINAIFDFLSESFVDIHFCSGKTPDQALAGRIMHVLQKNDLVLRDLGYYALPKIKEIEKNEAYYISRLKSDVTVYESKDSQEALDLSAFLDKKAHQGVFDIEVYIGKEKHPVRLVGCEMSEEGMRKRQRVVNKNAKRSGKKMSKKKSGLLKYCLFITNINASTCSGMELMAIYRARWRVELLFKHWKSCLHLHIFRGHKTEGVICLLYGRLIMAVLTSSICSLVMQYATRLGKELSCHKLTQYLINDNALIRALQEDQLDAFIKNLSIDIPKRLCMDKRTRLSLRSNVRTGQSYYVSSKKGVKSFLA